MPRSGRDPLLESLMESDLYSIGATLHDLHPEVIDDVVEQAEAIERVGVTAWARAEGVGLDAAVRTLMAGLAVRYYRAVNG